MRSWDGSRFGPVSREAVVSWRADKLQEAAAFTSVSCRNFSDSTKVGKENTCHA